jgi:hypothetical protein
MCLGSGDPAVNKRKKNPFPRGFPSPVQGESDNEQDKEMKYGLSLSETPVILATEEAEIRRVVVQRQLWQTVLETLS